jgi:hypothetical protein
MKDYTLLSPPGAGGSWLISTLHQIISRPGQAHYHKVWVQPGIMRNIHHHNLMEYQPPNLVVWGGMSWFNFYLNLIYKLYHLERHWLVASRANFLTIKMIKLVSLIREHERHVNHYEWEWLFSDQSRLHQKIAEFQLQHGASVIDRSEFDERAQRYIQSCVNPILIFEDWTNLYWVCAVLGQALYQSHKLDFTDLHIHSLSDQARALYPKLDAVPCVDPKTNLRIPDLVPSVHNPDQIITVSKPLTL